MDWSLGRYQRIAAGLLPAAVSVIERAAIRPGEQVLDVGCGTGNAALLAAERGARVIGVDPTPALLELAGADARERGVEASFLAGEAAALPIADGSIDAAVSVFGVIFAPDAQAAAAELGRVTAPDGRIVLSAWLPGGIVAEAMKVRRDAVAGAGGSGGGPPQAAWHDRDWVAGLLGGLGFAVEVEDRDLAFTAATPEAFVRAELADHPIWVGTRELLEPRGGWESLRDRALALFAAANEDPRAFRVTSGYAIVTARRA